MKLKKLVVANIIVAFVIAIFSPFVFAENGENWLIIKKLAEKEAIVVEAIAERQLETMPFSQLYAKEDLTKKVTVPFKKLYVQEQDGEEVVDMTVSGESLSESTTQSGKGIPFILGNGEFISHYTDKYCKNGKSLAVIKQVLAVNGKTLESAKRLAIGWSGLLPFKLLKEEFKNPLAKLSEVNGKMKQLTEQISLLKKSLVAEQIGNNERGRLINSLKKQLAERIDGVESRNVILTEQVNALRKDLLLQESLLNKANTKNSGLDQLVVSLRDQLATAKQEVTGVLSEFRKLQDSTKLELGNMLSSKAVQLEMVGSLFLLFLVVFSIGFFWRGSNLRKKLVTKDEYIANLREVMQRDKINFGITLHNRKREFSCFIKREGKQYDISPFEKKEGNGVTTKVEKKSTATDVIKGLVKRWLNNEDIPSIKAALRSGMLIEYSKNVTSGFESGVV